jgi:cytochrome c553
MATGRPRWLAGAAFALALLPALASRAEAEQTCAPANLGCEIFDGEHPLPAHLRDDDHPLPAWTARCVNCHSRTAPANGFAPPLTPAYLLDPISRRGGPPTRYTPAALCRALSDGIDPANVVLRKAMPHYTLSDTECAALWRFIING